jgi:hypothetical protein
VLGPQLAITQAEIDEDHIRIMRLACGPEGKNLRGTVKLVTFRNWPNLPRRTGASCV